ncbi:hypothetical protein HAX54_037069 [Datura stramonium]|uniref:Uncharacterized protein n=1 Tax=Datura stramonium TaxID=4076 RepID=A0ABS8SGK1_DATST|nr:hypothetical protein [Datura stramonium]
MHEKAPLLLADELTGNEKVEQMCLGALAICSFPGHSSIPISTCNDVIEADSEASSSGSKASTPQIASSAALADSDLHQVKKAAGLRALRHSFPRGVCHLLERPSICMRLPVQACQKTSSVSIQPQQDCSYKHE